MDDFLQPAERRGIAQNEIRQLPPVDFPAARHAGEFRFDDRRAGAVVQFVHRGVGIVDARARLGEQRRRGRFPHPNRARQANHDHRQPNSFCRALGRQITALPKKRQQRQERQTENCGVIPVDLFEELDAKSLDLVSADRT